MSRPDEPPAIRRAQRGDERTLAELNAIVQGLHHDRAPHIFKPPDPDAIRSMFREWLADTDRFFYLAEQDGDPVGYVLAQRVRSPGHALVKPSTVLVLDQIAVRPDVRRTGVGAALVSRVRELGDAMRIDRIDLAVWAFNDDAYRFFASQGFVPAQTRMSMDVS